MKLYGFSFPLIGAGFFFLTPYGIGLIILIIAVVIIGSKIESVQNNWSYKPESPKPEPRRVVPQPAKQKRKEAPIRKVKEEPAYNKSSKLWRIYTAGSFNKEYLVRCTILREPNESVESFEKRAAEEAKRKISKKYSYVGVDNLRFTGKEWTDGKPTGTGVHESFGSISTRYMIDNRTVD